MVITGMSELHLQIIQERLKRRDKVEVETREPKIPYRETIQAPAEGMYRHKKQTGGRGQFGEVHIRMLPFPKDTVPEEWATKARFPSLKQIHYHPDYNFLWLDSVVGGTIPGNFLPAIEKGFLDRVNRGVIAGYKVQDVCVEVHFGKHHPVDSSEQAFKTAGSMAFRNVFQQAKPSLLEPIVKMEITVPADKVGDINSDMSGRRGRVLGMDSAGGGMTMITAEVPLAEVMTYARGLSSMTGGQGSYSMEFSHYDVVPGNVGAGDHQGGQARGRGRVVERRIATRETHRHGRARPLARGGFLRGCRPSALRFEDEEIGHGRPAFAVLEVVELVGVEPEDVRAAGLQLDGQHAGLAVFEIARHAGGLGEGIVGDLRPGPTAVLHRLAEGHLDFLEGRRDRR